jgi:ATP-dependent RNA helicase DeaD
MELLELPSTETVNNRRIAAFKQKIGDTLAAGDLAFMQGIVEQYQLEHDVPAVEIAAALAKMTLGDKPLLLEPERKPPGRGERDDRDANPRSKGGEHGRHGARGGPGERGRRSGRDRGPPAEGMERFRIEIGRAHGVEPRNIVGAIANEAGLDGQHIGQIAIEEDHSFVDLPAGMPREIFRDLKKVWVCGLQLRISRPGDGPPQPPAKRPHQPKKKKHRGQ